MSSEFCQGRNQSTLGFLTAIANEVATRNANVHEQSGVSHCPAVLVFTSQFLHRASRLPECQGAVCDSGVCVSDSMMLIICPQAEQGEAEMWTETEMDRKRA